jgi:hypothetical protein
VARRRQTVSNTRASEARSGRHLDNKQAHHQDQTRLALDIYPDKMFATQHNSILTACADIFEGKKQRAVAIEIVTAILCRDIEFN